jgi:hypothetical protein
MVVLAGHLAAVAVEDDERRSSASTPAARLAEVGRVDGRGGHRRSSTTGRESASRCPRPPCPCPAGSVAVQARLFKAGLLANLGGNPSRAAQESLAELSTR